MLEEDRHPRAARVGDAIPVRSGAEHRAADDLDVVLRLQCLYRRFDGGEPQPEPPRQLRARQLAREVHLLQRELEDQIERQAGLLERRRGRGVRQHDGTPRRSRVMSKVTLVSPVHATPVAEADPGARPGTNGCVPFRLEAAPAPQPPELSWLTRGEAEGRGFSRAQARRDGQLD